MQFNPACLGVANSNVAQASEYISNNIPNNAPHIQNIPHNIPHNINIHGNIHNNVPSYDPQQNAWNGNVLASLPFYGIYTPSLVNVPTTPPTEASPVNIPVISSSPIDPKKKVTPKRLGPNELLPGEKPEDKTHAMDEEQKMKRQRRLLKNREAAQQFRQRQKEYIQNLERKVTELNTHVGETHKHIELLATENRLLRDQLVYLYNVMRQNLSLSPTSSGPSPSFSPATMSSPAPPPPAPPATIDLGLLGFKGYSALEGYEEMLKNANAAQQQQSMAPPNMTPGHSPSITPSHSPSITPTPLTPRIIPELATLSIAKGMEETCDMINNPMLMGRFGSFKSDHEAQTVPELPIKTEGGGGNM